MEKDWDWEEKMGWIRVWEEKEEWLIVLIFSDYIFDEILIYLLSWLNLMMKMKKMKMNVMMNMKEK